MSLTLTNIPRIMRAHGWDNAAKLLEMWFSRPAATAPAYGPPDTATIRMDTWVLTFPRARSVYNEIVGQRIWSNPAAQLAVAGMLRRVGRLGGARAPFGNLARAAPDLHAEHVNFRRVELDSIFHPGSVFQPDDMIAALGNFSLYVAIAGEAEGLPGGLTRVTVREVGVYVRDSFDFNGDQNLGYWDEKDNAMSPWDPLSGDHVTNASLREWRQRNGRGGDFLVFSDVKRTVLPSADVFTVR